VLFRSEIVKKWGKTITFKDTKYDLEEFKTMLTDNAEFFDTLKSDIVNKIKNTQPLIEEHVDSEI
jgi:hypothetical protein